jgi:DUF1365 family protein
MVMPLDVRSALFAGTLLHDRTVAPSHRFQYPLFMWLLDVRELPHLARRLAGFGYNRARPVSFHDADHFDGSGASAEAQLRGLVARRGVHWPGGAVRVLTQCRVLGYVFNPVSFWFCHTPAGDVEVVVVEVNNTFGERHTYVAAARPPASLGTGPGDVARLAIARAHDGGRCLAWSDKKVFHVSPFLGLTGTYAFTVDERPDRIRVHVQLRTGGERQMAAAMTLVREPLARASVPRMLLRSPFMTARVIAAIHWEALRLRRKGARYRSKPPYDPEAARDGVA